MLHVGPDLVGSSRLQLTFHERGVAESLEHSPVGDGRFSDARFGIEHLHAQAVFGVASNVALDAPLVLDEVAPHQCVIAAVCGLVEKLLSQRRLRLGCLGHHDEAAGVLVDAVNQSHLGIVGVERGHVAHVPCHGVDERSAEVAGTWVHHHAHGLVDHHQVAVLVDDVQGNLLGPYGGVVFGSVEPQGDDVARPHLVVALNRSVAHKDATLLGRRLYAVAARVLHVLSQKLIDAHGGLSGVHLHLPMLIELCVVGRRLNGSQLVVLHEFYIVGIICHSLLVLFS